MTGLTKMEQLLAFCDWERAHNPHPDGAPHIAEWAAKEIERLALERDAQADNATEMFDRANGRAIEAQALRAQIERMRALVANDAYAVSFQSMRQYRNALLAALA